MYHTSKLKSTPPIGAPNATEIPAAAAADRTSRFRAEKLALEPELELEVRTLIPVETVKRFHHNVCATACNMHERAFFSEPKAGCDR